MRRYEGVRPLLSGWCLLFSLTLIFCQAAYCADKNSTNDQTKKDKREKNRKPASVPDSDIVDKTKKEDSSGWYGVGVPWGYQIPFTGNSTMGYGVEFFGREGKGHKSAFSISLLHSSSTTSSTTNGETTNVSTTSSTNLITGKYGFAVYFSDAVSMEILGLGGVVLFTGAKGGVLGGAMALDVKVQPNISFGAEINTMTISISGSTTGISNFIGFGRYWF